MKSFLRYISEDMPHFDRADVDKRSHRKHGDSELTSTLIQRGFIPPTKPNDPPVLDYTRADRYSTQHKQIGNIGPYKVYHTQASDGSLSHWDDPKTVHSVVVKHKDDIVGHVRFFEHDKPRSLDNSATAMMSPEGIPQFMHAHTGKRAHVNDLPARVYMMAAAHTKIPIMSGETQSAGAHSMWHGITRLGGTSAYNKLSHEHIRRYDPDQHGNTVYGNDKSDSDLWSLIYDPNKD
jgi:hypothetical protein